jgi:hypothetical protein
MDMSFLRRARRILNQRTPAELDYGVLVATLEAMQSCSAAARAQVRAIHGREDDRTAREPLVEILLAAPDWPDAIAVQQGSFHRGVPRAD